MSEITAYLRGKTWSFSIHDKEFIEIYGERVRPTCDAKGKREAIKCGEETRARLIAEALSKKLSIQISPERILIDGKPAPLPTDTFAEFIDNWYKPWAELNKRPSTFKSDTWRLRVLVEHFGQLPLNQIIRPMVESFKKKEAERINQYGRKQTGAAVNRLLELGSAVFTKVAEWTDYEYNQVKHMQETFRAIIHEMGGTPTSPMPSRESGYGIATGGRIIHELGVTRMGNDPRSSVLNKHCQAHDVKNVFVADGGPFVSQADKNPTWTILALAWRTADYIMEQRKAGAL